jgi:hypothetical protein
LTSSCAHCGDFTVGSLCTPTAPMI